MPATPTTRRSPTVPELGLRARQLDRSYDAESVFSLLFGESAYAFWLDSSAAGPDARFSFMGDCSGPLGRIVTYDVDVGKVLAESEGQAEVLDESIFDYLERELQRLNCSAEELPFDFNGGFVGYFGYELKADCDGQAAHRSALPDAAFIFADRLIAFDHVERCAWLVCVVAPGGEGDAERWLDETSRRLEESMTPAVEIAVPEMPRDEIAVRETAPIPGSQESGAFHLRRSRERYLDDIAACKDRLTAGESYEICLTNKVVASPVPNPLSRYRALRQLNPAPYAAFLRFGEIAVLSSSPERFLRVTPDRWVETRPIKGTSRRGSTPARDARLAAELAAGEKSRAENVTIVDLMRNDLGIVCEAGTVHVPDLMRVETYETVHQLVSTVRGRLRDGVTPPGCIRACFPPGSMTGAPKRRTMEILDELEGEARGVYSGAIGYLGLGGGCDLSVAIRAIVTDGEAATVGCGGAIVLDSDPQEELDEMLLKAHAPMRAIDAGAGSPTLVRRYPSPPTSGGPISAAGAKSP